MQQRANSWGKIRKIDKPLARLTREKREKTQNQKQKRSYNTTETQMTI